MIGIDDVFDARIASRGQRLVGRPEELLLRVGVLDDRLDHEVGGHERVDGVTRASTSAGSGPPFSASFARLRAIASSARSTAPGQRVVERDAPAGGGDDLRDAAAHLAGADDENVLERSPVEPTAGAGELGAGAVAQPAERDASTSARITSPIDDLDRVAARLVAVGDERARVGQRCTARSSSHAPSSVREDARAPRRATIGSSVAVDEPDGGSDVDRPARPAPLTRWSTSKR